MRKSGFGIVCCALAIVSCAGVSPLRAQTEPGKRVSLGNYSLNIYCSGHGNPTVVVESGLGDFISDWALVQQRVERSNRICTYDRAGYGSSDPGPVPRTFAQLNLELHELLQRAGEKPPYILVGHSFGGPVMRNYAVRYPEEVAGMVLVESVTEHQPLVVGGKAVLLKDSATLRSIPEPSLTGTIELVPEKRTDRQPEPLPQEYLALPLSAQQLHREFETKAALEAAEDSQREWSPEYFAEWDEHPQAGLLGSKPLVVMTRASSGYDASPNYSLEKVDGQRLRAQTEQLLLSSNSLQLVLPNGHNLQLEAPDAVAWAITVTAAASHTHSALQTALSGLPESSTGGKKKVAGK